MISLIRLNNEAQSSDAMWMDEDSYRLMDRFSLEYGYVDGDGDECGKRHQPQDGRLRRFVETWQR